MYNLSLLSLGGYAVDTPAELERGYFYHSSAQKRSFDAAFCQLDSFPLPNKAFKEECALLAAIDNNDWFRSIKGTRIDHPELVHFREDYCEGRSSFDILKEAEEWISFDRSFKRFEPTDPPWKSFLADLESSSPSYSTPDAHASVSHPPLVAVDTQSPSESLKKSQSIKLNVENKTSQGHAAFFETVEKVGGGNSGSVYRVRNTPLLCKMFGGMEGHSGYYKREHFIREVNAYSRLRALGGIAVPRFYGAFERGDLLKAAIFLEDCGKALLSFDQMEPEETIKIFEIAKQVAEKGVLSDSFGARNVCKTSDGGYRMIDFGRSTVSMSRASINLWLEETADQLGILDQVRSRIYDENKEATTGEQ